MQRNRYLAAFLLLLIISCTTAVGVFSAGSQEEDPIIEAQELIEQREYNAAIKVLTAMLKNEPSRMDEIQTLLTQIRLEKENYNDKYEELIVVYGGDEVEAAYPLIDELQELDPNPNEATRVSLVLARETAGFVFNNNRWVNIMDEAAVQLTEQEYSAAVETYMTGFDLSRIIFRDAGYGNIVVNDVFARAETMDEESQEFLQLYSSLNTTEDRRDSSYTAGELNDYLSAADAMYSDLQRTAELRESLKDTADYYIVQEDIIRTAAGDDKQVHYLIYMDRLLNGRTTVEQQEGITGAIELYWNNLYGRLADESSAYSERLFNLAVQNYSAGALSAAVNSFDDARLAAESGIRTYNFGEPYFVSDAEYERPGLLEADPDRFSSTQSYLQSVFDVSAEFPVVIEKQERLDDLTERSTNIDRNSEEYRTGGSRLKDEMSNEYEEISGFLAEWEQTLSNAKAEAEGDSAEKTIAAVTLPVEEYGVMLEELLDLEIELAASLHGVDLAALQQEYDEISETVAEGAELLEGIPVENTENPADAEAAEGEEVVFEVLYKYPDRALELFLTIEDRVGELVDGVETVEEQINSERTGIRQSPEVREVSAGLTELLAESRDLLAESDSLISESRDQIFTAEKLKQEGERRIEDSKRLTQQANFTAAKERLEQAASKFDESLSYLEDPILRAYRDSEIPRLYEEIQVAENNLVVKQVREYLTQGKSSYSQGNFPAAQAVLIKAQNRWADTNVELNPEVEYWLTLTQTALSVTSGRVIAATDPLYAEMNQFLNQAREDFQNARDAYDRGRYADADSYFAKAEQSILYVQQFFPFNEEARVLNLRISQYRDPDQFMEIFGNDFSEARSLISSNPQKAYIDLKDLEAIDPDYPGMQAAITEAEYATGIKVRPPDTQKLTRSTELYKLAYDIVSRNIRSEFSVALSYLDEAINLNPNNEEAIRLKDRISTDVGGTATVVMSNADQQMYNEAVSEYTAGNYLKARIIVENLLKDPDNQRNAKLLDLKERIDQTR